MNIKSIGIRTFSFVILLCAVLIQLLSSNLVSATAVPDTGVKQGTVKLATATPRPMTSIGQAAITYPPGATLAPGSPVTPGTLPTGGAASPTDPFYCIDDEDPDGCDDQTAFHVPKGTGGAAGQCGSIMENAHKVVRSLPDPQQFLKAMRNSLNPAVVNTCHNTGTYPSPDYISTYFVIDTFNLTGFHELSKTNPAHVSGAGMMSWWKSQPAGSGYVFIPYTATVLQQHASGQQNLTGCAMFINMPSGGVHVGIFNVIQLINSHGDGVVSMLQSGARFILDRFPVVGWDVKNTPLHQTVISGVAGFGCHR